MTTFAVVFSGQGAQTHGMLADFVNDDTVRGTFSEASGVLGVDLWQICQDKDDTRLNDTAYTQPILLTASMALWRVLEARAKQVGKSLTPAFLAGHSLGEYSAFCAGNAMAFVDAVALVHTRGQLMSRAVSGKDTLMAAVLGLENDVVADLCQKNAGGDVLACANFNSVGQVVVAGERTRVQDLLAEVANMGKKAVPLAVSVPSHCALMTPAKTELSPLICRALTRASEVPVIQNHGARVHDALNDVKSALIDQLDNPVCWVQTMQKLASMDFIIECGAGNVLTNLAKRAPAPVACYPTDTKARLHTVFEQLGI